MSRDTSDPSALRMPASSTAMYPAPTTTVFLSHCFTPAASHVH